MNSNVRAIDATHDHWMPPPGLGMAVPPQVPGLVASAFHAALCTLSTPIERTRLNPRPWVDLLVRRPDPRSEENW